MKCPYCKEQLNDNKAKFCSFCGKPISHEQEEQAFVECEKQEVIILEDTAVKVIDDSADENIMDEVNRMKEEAENIPPEPPIIVLDIDEDPNAPQTPLEKAKIKLSRTAVVSIVLAFLVLGGIGLWMFTGNSPEKFMQNYISAYEQGDENTLLEYTDFDVTTPREGEIIAIYDSVFAAEQKQDFLRHMMTMGNKKSAYYRDDLNCFTLTAQKGFLGRKEYKVHISEYKVELTTGVPNLALYDNGAKIAAEKDSRKLEFYLLPGTHNITANYEEYGVSYPIAERSFTSFSQKRKNLGDMSLPLAKAEIRLTSYEDSVKLFINDTPTKIEPVNGYITVDPAFEGMELTVHTDKYTQRFTVGSEEKQRFEPYYHPIIIDNDSASDLDPFTLIPIQMDDTQLVTVAADSYNTFYKSYLKAINTWDTGYITNVSTGFLDELIERMEKHNEGYIFKLKSISADTESVVRYLDKNKLYVEFYVKASYDYAYKKDKERKWYADGNIQKVTMCYNRYNEWQVCDMQICDDGYFGTKTVTIKSK
ncbi:MAG: zinc ribbon domain-containing protein [Oscillospiraceae bacterium]|nr:zinc ribbon domain-containing protein [Oscillospiraceae bacterium]